MNDKQPIAPLSIVRGEPLQPLDRSGTRLRDDSVGRHDAFRSLRPALAGSQRDALEAREAASHHLQVDCGYYYRNSYDSKLRFACYWHQIDQILQQDSRSVLEVGIGNAFVSDYLRRSGVPVVTVDIDGALGPTVVGSVLSLPLKERTFDVVACFEVLEHLPYESFGSALRELGRLSRRSVIISVPDIGRCYRLLVTIPRLGERRWMIELPTLRRKPHVFDGQHYWEIGWRGFEIQRIYGDIVRSGFCVEQTFRVFEWPYHRVFVLRRSPDTIRGRV